MSKTTTAYEELVRRQARQLDRLTVGQLRDLAPTLASTRELLKSRLEEWPKKPPSRGGINPEDRFTAQQTRRALGLVEEALHQARERVEGALQAGVQVADQAARKHLAEQIEAGASQFGTMQRVDFDSAMRFASERGTLMERHSVLSERWNARAVRQAKAILAEETLAGSSISKVVDRLSGPAGPYAGMRSGANRLVRTEFVNRYNDRTMEGLRSMRDTGTMPKAKKRLITPMDPRTAPDSLMIVARPGNTVRNIDEPFEDPLNGRTFDHPPNRPNDRSRVVAWDDSWGDEWKVDETAARAELATRKFRAEGQRAPGRSQRAKALPSRPKSPSAALARERAVREVEAEIRNRDAEVAVAFDANGEIISGRITKDLKDRVTIPESIAIELRGGTLTHNHPGGTSFSPDDICRAAEWDWGSIRATGSGRFGDAEKAVTYICQPGKQGWPDPKICARRLESLDQEADVKLYELRLEGLIKSDPEGAYYKMHMIMARFADEFSLSYRKVVQDEPRPKKKG